MVITGAKSAQEIHKAVMNLRDMLKDGITSMPSQPKQPLVEVQNVVASGNIGCRINLELAALLLDNSMYEPEQFPGLIFRMDDPKVVILIFASGKLVCTGATKEVDVYKAVAKLHKQLEEKDLIYYD